MHLLDAAIRVLGERGVRAVTHRAVDAEAGVSAGSTANYFSTREGLFAAIVERFSERERRNFDDLAATLSVTSPVELGRALGAFARDEAGPDRTLTLSRYALLVESATGYANLCRLLTVAHAGTRVPGKERELLSPSLAQEELERRNEGPRKRLT